jgi:NAD(P)H-hydrate repair Nnr-like enzyme with NAD(P)H-hydrate epimerase domain
LIDFTPPALDCSAALLSVEQMAEADRLTVLSGINNNKLMENVGRPLAKAIM